MEETPCRSVSSSRRNSKPYSTPLSGVRSIGTKKHYYSPAKEIMARFLEDDYKPFVLSQDAAEDNIEGQLEVQMEEDDETERYRVNTNKNSSPRENMSEILTKEEFAIAVVELQAACTTLRKLQLHKKASKRRLVEILAALKLAQADFDATCASSNIAEHEVSEWRMLLIENGYLAEDPSVTPVKVSAESFQLDGVVPKETTTKTHATSSKLTFSARKSSSPGPSRL